MTRPTVDRPRTRTKKWWLQQMGQKAAMLANWHWCDAHQYYQSTIFSKYVKTRPILLLLVSLCKANLHIFTLWFPGNMGIFLSTLTANMIQMRHFVTYKTTFPCLLDWHNSNYSFILYINFCYFFIFSDIVYI